MAKEPIRRSAGEALGAQARQGLGTLFSRALEQAETAVAGQIAPVTSAVLKPLRNAPELVGGFFRGLAGSPDETVVAVPQAKAAVGPRQAVDKAMAQGRTAKSPELERLFTGPVTARQLQAIAGVLPAPGKPRAAKDVAIETAAAGSNALYQRDLATALKASSPEEKEKAITDATTAWFQRQALLGGANLQNTPIPYPEEE